MGYYDDPKSVREYLDMAEGVDGRALVEVLARHLAAGSTVLELGMGPGKDLAFLSASYRVTGSDNAQTFLDLYRQSHPDADLLLLDAVTIDTERRFDGIYSNKVLQHLTREEARASIRRQAEILTESGIALHALWYGEGEEIFSGLRFVYYTEESFAALLGDAFEVVASARYAEMETDDSIWFVMRKV